MTGCGIGAALLVAAAMTGGTAAAQSHTTHMRSQIIENGRRVTIDGTGEARFSDADDALVYLEPGGRLSIEESARGEPERRVVWREDGGAVRRVFYRDDREARPGADDEAWIRRSLLHVVRESGAYAESRVARLFRRGGADAVLDETRRIASDGAKRAYYTALLRQPGLRPGDAARVLQDAGRRIASDGDKRATLSAALDRFPRDPQVLEAMLQAAGNIASDGDKSSLLRRAAQAGTLRDGRVRDAFFRTASAIASDGDKSSVLVAAMRADDGPAVAAGALRVARSIASDGDKSRVLTSTPPGTLRDPQVRTHFNTAMHTIASDGDKARVATWLARSLP